MEVSLRGELHVVRRPKVCGIRANISLSMHVWGACILNMLEVVDLMCVTSIRPTQIVTAKDFR